MAAAYLRRRGYRLLARNLRLRHGEVDLVAEDPTRGHLVIVEVKSGRAETPPPEVHLNARKQFKLTVLATQIIRRYRLQKRLVRFDLIVVVWPVGARRPVA